MIRPAPCCDPNSRFQVSRPTPLSSRPERTRISYSALLATTMSAVFLKENRMMLINDTDPDRKSRGAQWRDLQFSPSKSFQSKHHRASEALNVKTVARREIR